MSINFPEFNDPSNESNEGGLIPYIKIEGKLIWVSEVLRTDWKVPDCSFYLHAAIMKQTKDFNIILSILILSLGVTIGLLTTICA